MAVALSMERKSFVKPDEVRPFSRGEIDVVTVGGQQVALARFEPGWRWSESVKPIVQTTSCQSPHLGYVLSGTMRIVGDDGTTIDVQAGDAFAIPPGHDAWVTSNEPCVMFDVASAPVYAKPG